MLNSEQLIWIVSGPSGSGKTSLCDALISDSFWGKRLVKSVSFTTRRKRPGEKEGRDYKHITEEKFLSLQKNDGFLESEKIFGSYYGTPKKTLFDAKKAGKGLLLCIDVKGAQSVKRNFKNTVSIFILPPRLDVLNERLRKRSTENEKDIEKRLKRVKIELSYVKNYDYAVVNDDFSQALKKIKAILMAASCKVK